ncbi:MAG: hypothetical protein MUF58_18330 [Arcicella sp.]|jgi:hypothetical protein|nr:hypothetical protein [Arcicella sp.]
MTLGECTIPNLEKIFDLKLVDENESLSAWINQSQILSSFQQEALLFYRKELRANFFNWNEQELSMHFIGPMLSLVDFTGENFNAYANRSIKATIGDIELNGVPDGMIAKGRREPEIPYFCFQEYKKEIDPNGHPAAQALGAMLIGQALNENKNPVYGCYVIGKYWTFMILEGKNYALSQGYDATSDEVLTIFQILLSLKNVVKELVA